jgi:hypothetical protein
MRAGDVFSPPLFRLSLSINLPPKVLLLFLNVIHFCEEGSASVEYAKSRDSASRH